MATIEQILATLDDPALTPAVRDGLRLAGPALALLADEDLRALLAQLAAGDERGARDIAVAAIGGGGLAGLAARTKEAAQRSRERAVRAKAWDRMIARAGSAALKVAAPILLAAL